MIRLWLLSLLLVSSSLFAGEVQEIYVDSADGGFNVRMTVLVHAPRAEVYRILTDYERITELDPRIVESEVIFVNKDITRVRTKLEGCVAFFCMEFQQLQDIYRNEQGDVVASMIPEGSDFQSGLTTWRVMPMESGVALVYEASFKPNFWMPPRISKWVIRNKLEKEATEFSNRIEILASENMDNMNKFSKK